MPRECWFHYYTTKRARSARVKKRRRRAGERKGRRARPRRIRNREFGRLWEKISPPRRATYAFRVLRPLVVSLRRLTPPSRSSRSTTPRVASSQDGFYRRFPPRRRSRVGRVQAWRHAPRARARYVPRGRDIPAPSARVWIEPTRKADARRDFDGASPTSRPARPPALARDSYARLPARAPHARALLIAPWLTASLPALGSARGAPPSPPPSQPRLPARRPAA